MRYSHFIISFLLTLLYYKASQAQLKWKFSDSSFIYTLTIDSIPHNDHSGYDYTCKQIDIFKKADGKKIQIITPSADNHFETFLETNRVFVVEDMNFDGHNDFRLLNMLDARLQSLYFCWLYNPANGQFERDTALDGLYNLDFDAKTKTVHSFVEIGAEEEETYTYHYNEKGKLELVYQKSVTDDISGTWKTTTIRRLVSGRMKETSKTEKNN